MKRKAFTKNEDDPTRGGWSWEVLGAQWARKEGEDRRELRMNPARLELRARRKLNNPTSLYIENAACDPLSQIKVPALGLWGGNSEERKLGGKMGVPDKSRIGRKGATWRPFLVVGTEKWKRGASGKRGLRIKREEEKGFRLKLSYKRSQNSGVLA